MGVPKIMSSFCSSANDNGQSTVLFDQHQKHDAKFHLYAGWNMPIYYDGIRIEHQSVVNKCGLFDASHMGQFLISGSDAISFIRHLLPFRFKRLSIGRLQYTSMCNINGGVVDDLLIYRLRESEFLLIVNASRTDEDWKWIQKISKSYSNLEIVNRANNFSLLALQGPISKHILGKYSSFPVASLGYFNFTQTELFSIPVILSRNGYTGEDGFEIIVKSESAEQLWKLLLREGAKPCGLASRDILRIEMGFALYGNELSEDITPMEGGIGWTIDWSRIDEYIGGKHLKQKRLLGNYGRLYGIEMVRKAVPRRGYNVFDQNNNSVGVITSGTQSPTLKKGIALARLYLSSVQSSPDLYIDIRGKMVSARIRKLPFRASKTVKPK